MEFWLSREQVPDVVDRPAQLIAKRVLHLGLTVLGQYLVNLLIVREPVDKRRQHPARGINLFEFGPKRYEHFFGRVLLQAAVQGNDRGRIR